MTSAANLVCAQDFCLLSLIPPKRKAQLFLLEILGGSQSSALKGSSQCRPAAELGSAPGCENGGAAPQPRANLGTDPGTALAGQELLTQGSFLQGAAQERHLSC